MLVEFINSCGRHSRMSDHSSHFGSSLRVSAMSDIETTPKKPRQSSLDAFLSPSKSPSQASESEVSPAASVKRAICLSDEVLERSVVGYKKLRSSPQYRSEVQIRDFYQQLELQRVRQLELKKDGREQGSQIFTLVFVIAGASWGASWAASGGASWKTSWEASWAASVGASWQASW